MGIVSKIKNFLGMQEEQMDLETLLSEGSIDKAKSLFTNRDEIVTNALKEFSVEDHEVMNRPNKILKGGIIEESWKLPISYQEKIVQASVAFLFGKPIKLKEESEGTERAFKALLDLRKDMRMASKHQDNARHMMSHTESAILFVPYRDANADKTDLSKKNSLRCILLAKKLGDTLHVLFDSFGVLKAVGREYKTKDGKDEILHFDVYLPDTIYYSEKAKGVWQTRSETNLLSKIPIVYYKQDSTEWGNVQRLIHRREILTSRRADNNDRMGDPILLLWGDTNADSKLPDSKTSGKVINMGRDGKAEYLVPEMSVDMVKNEKEDLKELIHYLTDTPDLSMDKMSSLGLTSGKAIEMAFFGAILKAMSKHGYFEEMIDREISILKAFMEKVGNIELASEVEKLQVSIEFGNVLPDNTEDVINMLSSAVGGKPIMSQKTAVSKNPLVNDADLEIKQISDEAISTIEE